MNGPVLDRPRDDAFDLLVRANPVPDHTQLASTAAHPPAQQTLARLRAGAAPVVRLPIARRTRRRIIAVAILAGAAASVAAAWVLTRPADDPHAVQCFGQASADGVVVGVAPSGTALETCAALWRDGPLGSGEPPALVGCRLANGTAGVFPSPSPTLCDDLGLARLTPSQRLDEEAVTRLNDALTQYFATHGCVGLAEGAAFARTQLDALDLPGWTVDVRDALTADRPCASHSLVTATRTVVVLAGPRRGGAAPPATR
jgi:hypothetical protein